MIFASNPPGEGLPVQLHLRHDHTPRVTGRLVSIPKTEKSMSTLKRWLRITLLGSLYTGSGAMLVAAFYEFAHIVKH